jgi:putative FmdB family regulatory protein
MPTYEYACRKCGHTFELFQAITDRPRSRCPQCRGKVDRLIGTGVGIVFKGSGFYATDSRPRKQEDASGATAEKSAKPSAEKTPQTPAAKGAPSTRRSDKS